MFKNSQSDFREAITQHDENPAASLSRRADEGIGKLAAKRGFSETQHRYLRMMTDVALSACRVLAAIEEGEPEGRVAFAKHIFTGRELMGELFPHPEDGSPHLGFCLECDAKKNGDYSNCTHQDIHRLAVLSVTLLNCAPPYDMDLEGGDDD